LRVSNRDEKTMMLGRKPSTGYSRGPDLLLVALIAVAVAAIALAVVIWQGAMHIREERSELGG
jgi:hypothetical protein